uniref:RRM domain-containing protein n=1 Tax=Trypanosoma congolense (strain IL3000) TaxID=1068625 RepID=G0UPV1_TRYCI|nr:conserved hypothetical protein [Trypanosoma congolense IL3000]
MSKVASDSRADISVTLAKKMQGLLQQRAEQMPLPDGYMRCPLNPAHQVPIAVIVTHITTMHQHDSLDCAADAMYGVNTHTRCSEFIKTQLDRLKHNYGHDEDSESSSGDDYHRPRRRRRRRWQLKRRHSSESCSYSSDSDSRSSSHSANANRSSGTPRMLPRGDRVPRSPVGGAHREWHGVLGGSVSHQADNVAGRTGHYPATRVSPVTTASSVLFGRYPYGYHISRERLSRYLKQFGAIHRLDIAIQSASIYIEFKTARSASLCLHASKPHTLLDGVPITFTELPKASVPRETINLSANIDENIPRCVTPNVLESAKIPMSPVPPSPPPHLFQPPPTSSPTPGVKMVTPSIITVGGQPVGVTGLGAGADKGAGFLVSLNNGRGSAAKGALVCTFSAKGEEPTTVRDIWNELRHFGEIKNILLVGQRAVVEFVDTDGVEKAVQALEKEPHSFAFCALLSDGRKRQE